MSRAFNCHQGRECHAPCQCLASRQAVTPFAWLRRELIAAANIPKWIRTYYGWGFSRTRSVYLAWRTTRPVGK